MRATETEFRFRFWFIGLIYWAGFACYSFDHRSAGEAIARLLLGAPFDVHSMHDRLVLQGVFAFGAALAIVAETVRTWGTAYLRSAVVHDLDLHSEALVADGPYRWVRNPLYFGGVLMGAGIGLMASPPGWFVIVILLYVFYRRLILREESELRRSQGDSYAAYCARVPRFWPALGPQVPSRGTKPRWLQAFGGESFLWACVLATAVFAATLNQRVMLLILGVALAGYAVAVFGLRRYWRSRTPANS